MLFQSIDRERPCGVGRRRQDIGLTADAQNVRRMPAPGPPRVVGMDSTTAEGGNGVLHKPGFVQRISVNRHLHIILFRYPQATVDGSWRGPPVLMQLQAQGTGLDLFPQRLWHRAIALAEKPQVDRVFLSRLQHAMQIPGARRASRGFGARGWASPT